MAFTSLNFLIFALAVVILYYIIPIYYRWVVLLVGSYVFYLISGPKTFVFVLLTTVITYLGELFIGKCNAD